MVAVAIAAAETENCRRLKTRVVFIAEFLTRQRRSFPKQNGTQSRPGGVPVRASMGASIAIGRIIRRAGSRFPAPARRGRKSHLAGPAAVNGRASSTGNVSRIDRIARIRTPGTWYAARTARPEAVCRVWLPRTLRSIPPINRPIRGNARWQDPTPLAAPAARAVGSCARRRGRSAGRSVEFCSRCSFSRRAAQRSGTGQSCPNRKARPR